MGRRILYSIVDDGSNRVTDEEWSEILRLQHWYNSEFDWSTGKIAIKRYLLFPNSADYADADVPIVELMRVRLEELREKGYSDISIVSQLEADGLVTVKWGGILDSCVASGFTRVADNEWNAYLVCEFLLKASAIVRNAIIGVRDEGGFIKTGRVWLRNREAMLHPRRNQQKEKLMRMASDRRIFAIVDRVKYDRHGGLKNQISGFARMKHPERVNILKDWNWLGYGNPLSADGGGGEGYDLNSKVKDFHVVERGD